MRKREWPEEEWSRIRVVGEIFASTFGRYHALHELENAEAALRATRAELAHATRVATLGELAATIAHEVNQPLAAIVSDAAAALNWLSDGAQNIPRARESLEAIVREGGRAGEVLTRIRALIKRSAVEAVSCDIRALIEGVLPLLRGQFEEEDIQVETALSSRRALVTGDLIELQQVVLNMVLNASDAIRRVERGQRHVSVQSTIDEGETGPSVIVSVADNGPGLGSDSSRLFEAFYTTKVSGLGMGLPISKSIIERHGGRMWAESNVMGGATFRFSLPLADDQATPSSVLIQPLAT